MGLGCILGPVTLDTLFQSPAKGHRYWDASGVLALEVSTWKSFNPPQRGIGIGTPVTAAMWNGGLIRFNPPQRGIGIGTLTYEVIYDR